MVNGTYTRLHTLISYVLLLIRMYMYPVIYALWFNIMATKVTQAVFQTLYWLRKWLKFMNDLKYLLQKASHEQVIMQNKWNASNYPTINDKGNERGDNSNLSRNSKISLDPKEVYTVASTADCSLSFMCIHSQSSAPSIHIATALVVVTYMLSSIHGRCPS